MANTQSARKALRQSKRRYKKNKRIKTKMKAEIKKVRDLKAKKTIDLKKDLSEAFSEIDKAVKKGVIHKNTGARYKSRLSKAEKKLK